MGRKAKHSQEEVFEVANKIAASGEEVTPTTLFNALGGSLTTIYKHFAAWQSSTKTDQNNQHFEMPESVKNALNQVWQIAAAQAAKDIDEVKKKTAEEIQALTRRLNEAIFAITQIENDSDSLETENELLKKNNHELEIALQEQKLLVTSSEQNSVIKDSLSSETIDQLKKQLLVFQDELDQGRREHSESIERLSEQIRLQKQSSAEVIDKITKQSQKIEAELKLAREDNLNKAKEISALSGKNDVLKEQILSQERIIKSALGDAGLKQSTSKIKE